MSGGDDGDSLDGLLERMVPGAGDRSLSDADAPPFPAGLELDPVDVLARGSVGWVYRARDRVLDRIVAVKVSRPDAELEGREALLLEARRTARLAHPAILPVHRVQATEGLLCVVFALGPTTTLADHLAHWRQAPDQAWAAEQRLVCLRAIAAAVAHAHGLEVVHGDLKPANVAVDQEAHPYVLDWSGLVATAGTFSGTPEYAAPERLVGGAPSPASDVFALAAIAWELLADRPLRPLPLGASPASRLARLVEAPGPTGPPPGVEASLGELLHQAAAPDPGARPTAAALVEVITRVLTGRARAERRRAEAEAELQHARREVLAFRERERRLQEERRVIAVQRARIPSHAPPAAKQGLWATEDRASALLAAQARGWVEIMEHLMAAAHLQPERDEAQAMIAEMWSERWPVVGVSLADAEAFARWEGARLGLDVRLPTEEEWEKAARGADGRAYPWGDAFDPSWCHMRDSLAEAPRPAEVGRFPADRSPYGVCDVAGGVHEWTTSVLSGDRHVVVRGGSWASDAQACRLASRSGVHADSRRPTVGFRVVISTPGDRAQAHRS